VHISTSRPVLWCIEVKPTLGSLSSPKAPRRDSHREIIRPPGTGTKAPSSATDELSRGIRELGLGVARAAEGVGKELEWLTGGRGGRKPSLKVFGNEREPLVEDGDAEDVGGDPGIVVREEAGWKRLD